MSRLSFMRRRSGRGPGGEVSEMSEEQKKQAEAVFTGMDKLEPVQREVAMAYVQGMTAAAKLLTKEAV